LYQKSDALVRRTLSIAHGDRATRARQLAALGESQSRLGDYEASLATFRRAAAQAEGSSAALRSRILVGMGQALSELERTSEADRILRRALRVDQARGAAAGNDLARDLEALGRNFLYGGDLGKARPFFLRALSLRRQFEGQLSPSVSDNLNSLGEIAYARRELRDAERYFRGNLAIDEKVLGSGHPDTAKTMNNLARALIEQRRHGEARPLLQQALAIARKQQGDGHPDMAFMFANLAIASRHTGQRREAETLFKQAIAVARQNEHRILGPSLADLAEIRCSGGRADEGMALLDEAARVTAADYPDKPWRLAWVENIRGECLIRQGRRPDGVKRIADSSKVILREWPRGTLFANEAERRLHWSQGVRPR
jgi:tetratricopeptide (TPR) repeat protein